MIRRRMLSVILAASVAIAGFTLVTFTTVLGQHSHQQQPGTQQQHQHGEMMHGKQAGGMMHSPEQMQQMMSQMAQNPEMLKHHLTMMMTNSELRPALVKLLKEDAELRQVFESLLSEVKE